MKLTKIQLHQFRNVAHSVFTLHPSLTVIVGENARGKTNILEAIYVLAQGTGFRESREEELVMLGKNTGITEGLYTNGGDAVRLAVHINITSSGTKKTYLVQKVSKRSTQYIEAGVRAVLFAPEQIEIITGAPDLRRDYFNRVIGSFDIEYRKRVLNLESALRKRNKILEHGHEGEMLERELAFWDGYIIEQAQYITKRRQEHVDYLNDHPSLDSKTFHIAYLKNEATPERFIEKRDLERRIRKTVIGPQKDDFCITLGPDKKDVHRFGSRSEQRLAIFWLKMSEITLMEAKFGKLPILLLDDVFSEFDTHNRKLITDLIATYQTVLTTAETEVLDAIKGDKEVISL